LQNPFISFIINILRKRDILLYNLLINAAIADNISLNSLIIAPRVVDFPFITPETVYNIILRAGNITLSLNNILTIILKVA